jgi:phage major head subunit gpT-like protein
MAGFGWDVVVNPRLTDDDLWYMFRTDGAVKPFIMQDEMFETGTQDDTFLNNRILFGVKAIRNVGNGYWQYAAACQFS